jgi:hypothetical protein
MPVNRRVKRHPDGGADLDMVREDRETYTHLEILDLL